MIIVKDWTRHLRNIGLYHYEYHGIFLLGIIPLYIKRKKIY